MVNMQNTHRTALRRLRKLEQQAAEARADLGDALQDQINHGVKVTYLADDLGISRQTIYKYLQASRERREASERGDDQGKANEPLATAAA